MNPPNKHIQTVNNPLMRCVSTFDGSRTSAAGYKLIPPINGKGKFAIVDAKNYEWLNQWEWYCSNGLNIAYRTMTMKEWDSSYKVKIGTHILMHRFILNAPKGMDVDHINHNRLDNRECNLRICTRSQNLGNCLITKGRKYKGIKKRGKKWQANITCNYKKYYLGIFDSEIEAAKAYDAKALELFGEFAYTNF